jgi:tripartite-type tricarboxylate transporter receptor subunit TctC
MRFFIRSLITAFAVLMVAGPGNAQSNYPTRSIRLLFGFAAGTDVGVRIIAEKLAADLKQPAIVENISGAAGNIAADQTANADPDGYAVGMLTGANIVLRPMLYRNLSYDPLKRLVPVSLIHRFPNVLVVNNDFKAATLGELVEAARAAPGSLTFGHLGVGSVSHLSGELLKIKAGIDIRAVPYRGVSTLFADITAGQITMAFAPPSLALPMVKSGKLRGFAVTSQARIPFAADLPTVGALQRAPDSILTKCDMLPRSWLGQLMQFDQLKRRDFITVLGGAAAPWPMATHAQQAKVWRVGVLETISAQAPTLRASMRYAGVYATSAISRAATSARFAFSRR